MENNNTNQDEVQAAAAAEVAAEAVVDSGLEPELETLPVEVLETKQEVSKPSCTSCASISTTDNVLFGLALLVPLIIKQFKRI